MRTSAWILEPPRADELADITRLFVESDIAEHGTSDTTEVDVGSIWSWPGFDREKDAFVARAADGTLAGYAWVHGPLGPQRYVTSRFVTRPGSSTDEVGGVLLDRIEARALELSRRAERQTSLATMASSTNLEKRALLERRGYELIRVYYQMERELAGTIPTPQWPPGLTLAPIRRPDDEREVFETLQDAFSEHFRFFPEKQDEWVKRTLDRSDFVPDISYVVRHEGMPVAAVINYLSAEYGWVSDLGVVRAWRRRGLASALLLQSFRNFQERGMRLAGLGVDSENDTRAVSVYERVGLRVTQRKELFERILAESSTPSGGR
jgi:mycothiol synthase